MKKIVLSLTVLLALIASFIVVQQTKKRNRHAAYTIGILQTASHPALDASREGFIEELKNKMGNDIDFVLQNAQGSVSQAHAIAQQFNANKQLSGFFTIATPATQAMAALERERPIVIASVTDPSALGLVDPRTNVSGIQDMINVASEVDMLIQLVPLAKTVGIIYTAGEMNSIALVKRMHEEVKARGLIPVEFALSNESDIQAVVELACRKTDVLLAPTDNTIASAISLIATLALKFKKPLLVSDNMLVAFGALASRGVDYKLSGKQAAQIAYEILVNGKKPHELPIEQAQSNQIVINQKTLNLLGLTIPESLQKDTIVYV